MSGLERTRPTPDALPDLPPILAPARGRLDAPIRSEIFGRERFAQHGRSLGDTHRAERRSALRRAPFFPRMRDNIRVLREAHAFIGLQAGTGYQLSPAAEWLLDNFHLIEGQLEAIHDGLPRRYFARLPMLIDAPLAGLPRIYSVAWAFVAHTDGAFDEDLLAHFLAAYQETRPLDLGELWALPTTLRVVLVENLRRLAERLAAYKAVRELANLICDELERWNVDELDALLGRLAVRGVDRVFLLQMAQRLPDAPGDSAPQRDWLARALPDLAAAQVQAPTEQAADNLSVSNAIGSLRAIANADWATLVSNASGSMQLLLGSPAFERERNDTRDMTLHAVESLARRSGLSEIAVTQILLELMRGPSGGDDASHWLRGAGRPGLMRRLGLHDSAAMLWRAWRHRAALPTYLATLCGASLGLVAWMVRQHTPHPSPALMWISAALLLVPASEAVVALVNRMISESVPARRMPRFALAHGIPPEHRVMVVVPGLLTHAASVVELAHRLELHHLANPEAHTQFALLTDWADADAATHDSDAALLDAAERAVSALNSRYANGTPRFIVLHRERVFSDTQQRWIGWERKRGKLEQLIACLAEPSTPSPFIDLGIASRIEPDTRYVVTLDGDTQLPPGRLRELVGVAAHPHNQPVVDPVKRIVTQGYGILQPHVATPLPAPRQLTLYHELFAGQCGIDPYSAASAEVYQDVFGEGSFTGKGLLNVAAMHAVLGDRLPEGRVLSHDLLEGSLARCASVSDVSVIEEAPFHADVAASRVHRWTRGDWQLLPFLLQPRAYPLRAINRWKMIDNLRRSLVAPTALALLLFALATHAVTPLAALALVFAAFTAGPLLGALAGFAPSRDAVAKRHFYRRALDNLRRAVGSGLWQLAELLRLAITNSDAIVRALYRMTVSRRGLLEWTTAAAAQASATTNLRELTRRHAAVPITALVLWAALLWVGTPSPLLATLLCAVWAAAPLWTWWVSRPIPPRHDATLPAADQAQLHATARDTWRLFERIVGAEDRHLPPDNLQLTPQTMLAHRTSPTNIGMYLLCIACARRFGWIGTTELIARIESTLSTLDTLERHRGHLLNWYDTQSGTPLLPRYVSTVDSGNLSGHLLALAQACIELAEDPFDSSVTRAGLRTSLDRLAPLRGAFAAWPESALGQALALDDPRALDPAQLDALLRDAAHELSTLWPDAADAPRMTNDPSHLPATAREFAWRAADHLATLRSARLDLDTFDAAPRLRALAARCEGLAWLPDFGFLYHRKRHLFHIGYRVAEQQLDASYYDLLASESRLTSLLAIAKGDVPVAHWAALARPFYAVGARAGLRSWSGSMFEYLMPTLVLDEPHGSVLSDAGHAALAEQVAFAAEHAVPWGISESAYAASDHTLAYQYAPQGVPRLALRRTPGDELVIAPYATALAVQIAPHRAVANFAALRERGAAGRYGFIEALDYTAARRSGDSAEVDHVNVDTYMAHHQGMSIVAIANVLLDGAPRRWGMGNAHIEAVASLLHERAPREVPLLRAPPLSPNEAADSLRNSRILRDIVPGMTAVAPTQLLSNGRYSVALRANGAGWSRWGSIGVNRTRDDALRDAHGSFFYLRWDRQPQAVSITQHPAPDAAAHYQSTVHADRVCFDARWPELQAHATVWVSPEDDIEIRQIELRNLGERALDLELMSAFEITLADARADEAHPAFSNLFLRARWLALHRALVFERTPRLAGEPVAHAAHFIVEDEREIGPVRAQPRRLGWLGRNHDASRPAAAFPPASTAGEDLELDTGLDSMCALAVQLRLEPHSKLRLTFCTAATDNPATLAAVIDKYRQSGSIERSSLMSATLHGIRLREFAIGAETLAAIQTLTTAIVLNLTRNAATGDSSACDRRALWRFGISGDRPIVLVSAGSPHGMGLLRALAQALRLWSWAGVECDLVIVNAEPASYHMPLQHEAAALRDQLTAQGAGAATGRMHVLRADELSPLETTTLRALARVHLNADGRPLSHHMREWSERHEQAFEERLAESITAVPVAANGTPAEPSRGAFAQGGAEFGFDVDSLRRPARPWVNVLANPGFGAQISEAGGGYSWAMNSRLNQLTPWSNDSVADVPGEWFLLQDWKTREVWSVAPSAWGDPQARYHVAHGQGTTTITHRRGALGISAEWCVDPAASVKHVRLRIINDGGRTARLRAIGIAEWIVGAARGDRASTATAAFTRRLPTRHDTPDGTLIALSCTQRDRAAGFGEATPFLGLVSSDSEESLDWTCDRRECFDARGRLVVPDHFGRASGAGLDPCAALSTRLSIPAGASVECIFMLGFGVNPAEARQVATAAASVPAAERRDASHAHWDRLLGATTVRTPDPLFDAMVNRWLLYQTIACRLWAKAGFYQAGGAFGFRDQLQDAMALAWPAPSLLRDQIVLSASRQFVEGDVQHWWHAPTGAGVRTHFSDDLLWLPLACAHYVQTTGDASVLDERVPFLTDVTIPEGAEDAYAVPGIGAEQASVFEHAARAIDRSLRVGAHGLPLMGSGDWNDGMNRVGAEGRGESVWLGWFLCKLLADFLPLALARGETARAAAWQRAARGWRGALLGPAWDGAWFKRAFFDDGTPLGSHANAECQVDLIAQAWAVISGVAPPARREAALDALERHLVDPALGLLKLLTPPLRSAQPSAGYIQAYPKGVRENGGQYAHAGVWALIAQAMSGNADAAYRYFTYLSPAHRAAHVERGRVYEIEPYVMAGDVYSEAPYAGRGGWSWYTGSAGWMHRASIENLFGLRLRGSEIAFAPCLPSHWQEAELTLNRDGRVLRVLFCRPLAGSALERAQRLGAVERAIGVAWNHMADDAPACVLLRLPASENASRSRPTAPGLALRWAADEAPPTVSSSPTTL